MQSYGKPFVHCCQCFDYFRYLAIYGQIIRFQAKATIRPQIKQYIASNEGEEGVGYKTNGNIYNLDKELSGAPDGRFRKLFLKVNNKFAA